MHSARRPRVLLRPGIPVLAKYHSTHVWHLRILSVIFPVRARDSCHRFRSNEVTAWADGRASLAYNLGNLWRKLVLPEGVRRWSLTSLQQGLVKTDGRLVEHTRYHWLLLAESHLTRRLFGAMLRRIQVLPLPAG
jgi:hypothetical protein